jgi:hypothetical protein
VVFGSVEIIAKGEFLDLKAGFDEEAHEVAGGRFGG